MLKADYLRLPIRLSESLQNLVLKNIDLLPSFDWTELINLTKIDIINVRKFNKQNFIEFIRRRPRLKHFYLYSPLDDGIGKEIGEALGKYCGDQIQYFSYQNNNNSGTRNEHFYNFLSELKIVKRVGLSCSYRCASDLKYAIKWLAENDTIEDLKIVIGDREGNISECPLQNDNVRLYMKKLTKLKTIRIFTNAFDIGHTPNCNRLELFSMYSVEILSNVEMIQILFRTVLGSQTFDFEFIKFVPKLRVIYMLREWGPANSLKMLDQAARIVADLKSILQRRRHKGNRNDFIEFNVDGFFFDIFRGIDDIGDSIKLIKWEDNLLSEIIRN